jgi:hypothetical protein
LTAPHEPWPPSYAEPEPEYEPRRPHSRRLIRPTPWWRAWREWPLWAWGLVGILVGLLVFLVLRLALHVDDPDPGTTAAGAPIVVASSSTQPTPTAAPVIAPPTADLPERQISGDAPPDMPYIVGVNIAAGRYVTAGALHEGTSGRWSVVRLRSKTNAYEPTAGGSTSGAAQVDLRVGDIFYTQGYRPWTKI